MTDQHADYVAVVPPLGRVVRYSKDQVGNDLTAALQWCDLHDEPVWIYGDGSFCCPHERVVEVAEDHLIVTPPWELHIDGSECVS